MTAAEYHAAVAFARDTWVPVAVPWPIQMAEICRRMPDGDRAGLFPGLLEDARSDGTSWDALELITADMVLAGDTLPPDVAAWVTGVLKHTRRRPVPTRPGPDPTHTQNRNSAAVSAVAMLRGKGYWPITRAKSKPGMIATPRQRGRGGAARSVCDAVAEAFGVSYWTMQAEWWTFTKWERAMERADARYASSAPYTTSRRAANEP